MDIVHENGGVLGSGDYDGGFLDLYDLCSGFIVSLMLTVIIRESASSCCGHVLGSTYPDG